MRCVLLVISLMVTLSPAPLVAQEAVLVPVSELGTKYKLVGSLQVPLGETVTVEGVVVQGPFKGWEGGPNLRVQRIAGKATQEDIQIKLSSLYGDPPQLESGKTYRIEGYEDGGYVGTPADAFQRSGTTFQTCLHYFRTRLVVYKITPIEPVHFTPADFEGRQALFQGIARTRDNQSLLDGDGWQIVVDPRAVWPDYVEGRQVETLGTYRPDAVRRAYVMEKGTWGLVRLEDQVGLKVELRGHVVDKGDDCWFDYRGTWLIVENLAEWQRRPRPIHEFGPILVRGVLDKTTRPKTDYSPYSPTGLPQPNEVYVVKQATIERTGKLLSPERPIEDGR